MSELKQSRIVEQYESIEAREQRQVICRRLGTNETHRTALSKRSVNSLVAYFTGEFAVAPDSLFAEGAPLLGEMMDSVAREVGLSDWMEHYTDVLDVDGRSPRAFNKGERARILAAMDDRGDAREWARGEFGELG